jgi:hypothetical protein
MSRKFSVNIDRDTEAKALQGTYANHSHYNFQFEDDVEVLARPVPQGSLR